MFAFSEMYNFCSNEYYAWMYVYETFNPVFIYFDVFVCISYKCIFNFE